MQPFEEKLSEEESETICTLIEGLIIRSEKICKAFLCLTIIKIKLKKESKDVIKF